jgi:hypothetical protein
MRRSSWLKLALAAAAAAVALAGCGSAPDGSGYDFGDGGRDATAHHDEGGVKRLGNKPDVQKPLNPGCAAQPGATATVTGTVYDPAGKNPIYNVAVYVPAKPLAPLPRGVPTGSDACSCSALYPTAAYASASTAVDGTFTLTGVPTGTQQVVAQIGKWRRVITVQVDCATNAVPDRTLTLPGTVAPGDTDDNMPDIAVSTGAADSLECLLLRMGVSVGEYVAGADTSGHVHMFSGGTGNLETIVQTDGGAGAAEYPAFAGAPPSWQSLWGSASQLMPYDVVLLSCEGFETYNANPAALESYLNAGGRTFASHFHYSWFSGPLRSGQSYKAPADWGENLGTWSVVTEYGMGPGGALYDDGGLVNLTLIGGAIEPDLNDGSGNAFAKGATMQTWLGEVGALGQGGVPADQLSIYSPRYNVNVGKANAHSQPWLTASYGADTNIGATMYFSFNTPIDAPSSADGGPPSYCGRAVYSDLHVGGDPSTVDTDPPPSGCQRGDLSPQEKALEFMLFDLSSCVTDDALPVPDAGTVIIPPLR